MEVTKYVAAVAAGLAIFVAGLWMMDQWVGQGHSSLAHAPLHMSEKARAEHALLAFDRASLDDLRPTLARCLRSPAEGRQVWRCTLWHGDRVYALGLVAPHRTSISVLHRRGRLIVRDRR